jgi:hypothetical protein
MFGFWMTVITASAGFLLLAVCYNTQAIREHTTAIRAVNDTCGCLSDTQAQTWRTVENLIARVHQLTDRVAELERINSEKPKSAETAKVTADDEQRSTDHLQGGKDLAQPPGG